MRESTILPTNLLDWPRCGALLPDQRLILIWLWGSPYMTAAGWGFVPMRPAAATLGLDPAALAGGLSTLEEAGLIIWDQATGEVAILDWFRFHKFRQGTPARAAAASIKKIQSERIKNVILEKSTGYLLTATATATTTATVSCMHQEEGRTAPQEQPAPAGAGACKSACKKKTLESGVVCWDEADRQQVAGLVVTYGQEQVSAAAKKMAEQGMKPLPSRVSTFLKGQNDGKHERDYIKNEDDAAIKSSLQYYYCGVGGGGGERVIDIEGERVDWVD